MVGMPGTLAIFKIITYITLLQYRICGCVDKIGDFQLAFMVTKFSSKNTTE